MAYVHFDSSKGCKLLVQDICEEKMWVLIDKPNPHLILEFRSATGKLLLLHVIVCCENNCRRGGMSNSKVEGDYFENLFRFCAPAFASTLSDAVFMNFAV